MKLSYQYRLYPTKQQIASLEDMLGDFCELYNAALQQRIEAYRRKAIHLTYVQQSAELKHVRAEVDGLSRWSFSAEQGVLRRLEKSYRAFIGRAKRGGAGFPRFKARARFHAAAFNVGDGLTIKPNGRLGVVGIPGVIKVKWHRFLPSAPKSATLTRRNGKWFITFVTELEPCVDIGRGEDGTIGIDVGLSSLVALSNGELVKRPRWQAKAAAGLRRRQRALARAVKGSNRRMKAKERLSKFYALIAARRRDFLHKTTYRIATRYPRIAVECLNVHGMAKGHFAKSITDAAWTQMIDMFTYKAERAGGELIKVDSRRTSQTCPSCGHISKKELSMRKHECHCGLSIDRDVAAAIVVHDRAFGPGTGLRSLSQRMNPHSLAEKPSVFGGSVHVHGRMS